MKAINYRGVHDIADELGVDVQTVRRWIHSGKLRAFKPGKEYRVREADLEEFLRAREVRPKAPRRSPLEPTLLNGLEDERRYPSLQGWAGLINRFADRWEHEITERESEWQAAKPAIRKHVKLLPNLSWANEIRQTASDVLGAAHEQLQAAILDTHNSDEAREVFKSAKRLQDVLDRTCPWYRRGAGDARGVAEVVDFRTVVERMEREIGSQAS